MEVDSSHSGMVSFPQLILRRILNIDQNFSYLNCIINPLRQINFIEIQLLYLLY